MNTAITPSLWKAQSSCHSAGPATLRGWVFSLVATLSLSCAEGLAGEVSCIEVPEQDQSASFRFESSPVHQSLVDQVPAGARINSIRLKRHQVFDLADSAEDNRIYRLANDFHWLTRESVIRSQLLVAEGDDYQPARLRESERILRDLGFLYDARIRPWRLCGDEVDLEVVTRDVWTLFPTVSFTRSGGENDVALGLRDSNVLGTGKLVMLRHERGDERSGNTFVYGDPAVLGSRWQMRLNVTENDDGYDHFVALNRPFFSVYETWSAGSLIGQQELEEKIWYRGDEIEEFDHRREHYSVYGGIAADLRESRRVGRWLYGYQYERHEFSYSDSDLPPDELPVDRDYSYPFIGYQSTRDEYIEVHKLNYLGRTEDLYVGEHYRWSVGWSGEGLGASRDQLYFSAVYGDTLLVDETRLWAVDTGLSGFWAVDGDSFENLWWTGETRYHHRQGGNWALFGRLRLDYADGLTRDRQLTLGGDTGLRGYDRHYQTGDRSFLLNLEQRYYSDLHILRLVRVGTAAFVDVGRAWFEDRDNGANGDVLANAGIGLRFTSSRTGKGAVLHVDLAFPFVKDDDVDDTQLLITVRNTF